MLEKPKYGWTHVNIGNFSERASYLTDVPIDCLNAFINYYETGNPAAIEFDAEGWDYTVVLNNYTNFIISGKSEGDMLYTDKDIGNIQIDTLAQELIDDITTNLQQWVLWDTSIGCNKEWTEEDKIIATQRKGNMLLLVRKLERLLDDHQSET